MRGIGHVAHHLHRRRPVGHRVRPLLPPRTVRPAQDGSPLAQVPRVGPPRPRPPRRRVPSLRPALPPRVPDRRGGRHPPPPVEKGTPRPWRAPRPPAGGPPPTPPPHPPQHP